MDQAVVDALHQREPGQAVVAALKRLMRNDVYLLECDANERSLTHRFATHLQVELPRWHIDCEYNRDGVEPKRLGDLQLRPDQEDTDAKTVFPDVIAHIRGTSKNYLVIEVKKSSSSASRDVDLAKLRGYKRELGYTYALFIEFMVKNRSGVSRVEWVDIDA